MMWKRVYALRRVKAIPIKKRGCHSVQGSQATVKLNRAEASRPTDKKQPSFVSIQNGLARCGHIKRSRRCCVFLCNNHFWVRPKIGHRPLQEHTRHIHTHTHDWTGSLQTEHSPNNNKKTHKAQNTEVAHCEQFVVSCFMGDKQWPHIVNGWDGSQLAAISSSYGA